MGATTGRQVHRAWLARPSLIGLALAGTLSAVGGLAAWWSVPDYIRTAGGVAQAVGVAVVAWDVFTAWVVFQRPKKTPGA